MPKNIEKLIECLIEYLYWLSTLYRLKIKVNIENIIAMNKSHHVGNTKIYFNMQYTAKRTKVSKSKQFSGKAKNTTNG